MADANGFGIPLAFMFLRTTKDAAAGAKQAVLECFLGALKDLGVDPEFTLSDKDWSEINAMGVVWPDAKHQLCFWHGLRALKQRLSKNRDTPAPYDAAAAHAQFSFIDVTFVPVSQQPPDVPVRLVSHLFPPQLILRSIFRFLLRHPSLSRVCACSLMGARLRSRPL